VSTQGSNSSTIAVAGDLSRQVDIFTRYLVGHPASDNIVTRYAETFANDLLEGPDEQLLSFITRHPRSTGLIDAGLCLSRPNSEVRRRLYTTLALLEASPEYTDAFLPKKRSVWYLAYLCWSGLRAVLRAIGGSALLRVIS
jgi:hypothetical protein